MLLNKCIIVFTVAVGTMGSPEAWPHSTISGEPGHYPYIRCKITNVMLIPEGKKGVFYTKNNIDLSSCTYADTVWHFGVSKNIRVSHCDLTYDVGHVILLFYIFGTSNYYHIHWDTVIPLYKTLYYINEDDQSKRTAVMPSIESKRLREINWQTDGFSSENRHKYWNEMTEFMTGNHSYIPLDDHFLKKGQTICFKEIYFGTVNWNTAESSMIENFIKYVVGRHGIKVIPPATDRIGIIYRKYRRKILNIEELQAGLKKLAPTDLLLFENLNYKQQVELMQNYTVVAGMNGAGLINCAYLPPGSTCIQMVPYGAQGFLNFAEFGTFLKARGPYLEWHNTHANMHVANSGPHNADTTVHVEEFSELVKKALQLSWNAHHQNEHVRTSGHKTPPHPEL